MLQRAAFRAVDAYGTGWTPLMSLIPGHGGYARWLQGACVVIWIQYSIVEQGKGNITPLLEGNFFTMLHGIQSHFVTAAY